MDIFYGGESEIEIKFTLGVRGGVFEEGIFKLSLKDG